MPVKSLPYAQQLLHPLWQRRRLEMLQGANFTCQECGATEKTLHVHHGQYVKGRKVWEYEDQDLAVLCDDCHKVEHDIRDRLADVLSRMREHELRTILGYAIAVGLTGYLPGTYEVGDDVVIDGIATILHLAPDDFDKFLEPGSTIAPPDIEDIHARNLAMRRLDNPTWGMGRGIS